MRLQKGEKEIIIEVLQDVFGSVEVSLFGSRVDDTKRGGDIDLFVIPKERSNLFQKKIKALAKLERALHKPVDIVVHKNFQRDIEREILKNALTL
ncbi:hypothetical protein MNB_SM-7-1153 [hydrothermal vent metagenome]|uniref:Polymerase beta nucleotidyltransferase domain-containing protein n=1 Tax=hydrothermal vent metagenome TaxID=652676 RepID=A0A1W1BAU5_9ZZZZ